MGHSLQIQMQDLPSERLCDEVSSGHNPNFIWQARERYKPKCGNDPDIGARAVISPSEHNDLA
jgi:hypothetical protein